MPTYEYVCASCGNHFDTVQSFSDPPLERCEICGGQLRRVFHPAGILFKGSGFYSTDNRRAGSGGGKAKPGEKSERSGEKAAAQKSSSSNSGSSSGSSSRSSSEGSKTAEKSA
ncbi:MAG TPA: FmdB family zinc ribbon protein [Actinomycetota bacterium]|nr:FmdB family zinc ribbon protein [Actinomycetota bacterium]